MKADDRKEIRARLDAATKARMLDAHLDAVRLLLDALALDAEVTRLEGVVKAQGDIIGYYEDAMERYSYPVAGVPKTLREAEERLEALEDASATPAGGE